MFTLEQKVDIVLRYIASDDDVQKARLRQLAAEALLGDTEECKSYARDVNANIVELLKEVGVPAHLHGYPALVHAISMVVDNRKYTRYMGRLYDDVAYRMDSTGERVARNMRSAIESAFDRNGPDHMREVFGRTVHIGKGKPTNREFINACANEVLRRMGKPVI